MLCYDYVYAKFVWCAHGDVDVDSIVYVYGCVCVGASVMFLTQCCVRLC